MMNNVIENMKENKSDNIIEFHGKKLMLLENAIEDSFLPDPKLADIWVVNHTDGKLVKKFLFKMIRSENIEIYLKPIFLQKEFKHAYQEQNYSFKQLTDGYIKDLNFLEKIPFIDSVFNFIRKYKNVNDAKNFSADNFLIQKTFNYYYSRKKSIKPTIKRQSLTGYSYPRIEAYFTNLKDAFSKTRMFLQDSYLNGWLNRTYIDTSHLCKKCNGGFLNYREVCPKCSEHNLKASDLIHHFRCAYVGKEKDFINKNKYICPKCSSELKNLGVDYDKPGKIFNCKNKKCNHEFQDAPVGVHCVDCEAEQFPHELIVKKIYEYEITDRGIQLGLHLKK